MLNAAICAVLLAFQGSATSDIVGTWKGTSICTKVPENSACHDEVVVYDFRRSTDKPGLVTLDAKKIVNGKPEPMGVLDLIYDASKHRWTAQFRNSRVHILWSYAASGDRLSGTCVLLPSGTVVRNVSATRVPGKSR